MKLVRSISVIILLSCCANNVWAQGLTGNWNVTKITKSFPGERMSSQYSYLVSIDSAGHIINTRDSSSRGWIKPQDSLHYQLKWQYDPYTYRIDSISEDYLEIHYTYYFEDPEPGDPDYEWDQPLGYDPYEPEDNEVNSMEEVFVFRRVE